MNKPREEDVVTTYFLPRVPMRPAPIKHCFYREFIDMKTKSKKRWLMGKGLRVRSYATRIQT